MNIHSQINTIRNKLIESFSEIDKWLMIESDLVNYRPKNGSWTINEIIEHVSMTNYFLLILIEKGFRKALKNNNGLVLDDELKSYQFLNQNLEEIGKHESFSWIRPEHMEPKGDISLFEIKSKLDFQLSQCLEYLGKMPNGEGVLYKTTMTVNTLGKIDVYQYIYFLAMHIQRHLEQIQKVDNEYIKN